MSSQTAPKVAFAVGKKAREDLQKALWLISEAVGSTMGPGGRPFGFDKYGTDLRLTTTFSKDGLTVLRALNVPDDPVFQAVLQYCRQASSHSFLASGDGTTSTIILAAAVAELILKGTKENASPQYLARILEQDAESAIAAIAQEAVTGDEIVKKVALTSCNGDEELADVVIKAVNMSSAFGTLLVEKNPSSPERYVIDRQDGYSNCAGYNYQHTLAVSASSAAASSKPIEWQKPYVFAFNGDLILNEQIMPMLTAWQEKCKHDARNLVIVSYNISDEIANKLLTINRKLASEGLAVFVVKPKLTAETQAGLQILRDVASFVGITDAYIIDGGNYKDVDVSYMGECGRVKIGHSDSAFFGRSTNHWVVERIQQNQSIADAARSKFDEEIVKIRNAELAEGLVHVQVGGGLLPDLQERADRFDDASKAAQSCMRAGALPGGGCSYIRAAVLAGVHPLLEEASRIIYEKVLDNFGAPANSEFVPLKGQVVKINTQDLTLETGNAVELDVLDSAETVYAVIRNGVSLGAKVAALGGYSYRLKEEESFEY